jgi:sporulation protein YlmC with PRC-barrel domain
VTRKHLDAGLDLLDRHIVDRDDRSYGTVDDVELVEADDGSLEVAALLLGPKALGARVGGRLGRAMIGIARRASGDPEPIRIPLDLVDELGVVVKLRLPRAQLPEMPLERWVRANVIERIPGSRRATG